MNPEELVAVRARWMALRDMGFDAPVGMSSPEEQEMIETAKRNRPWAQGGPYQTTLTPQENNIFNDWAQKNLRPGDFQRMNSPYSVYDYRGFWKNNGQQTVNANDNQLHFPDKWKTPFHHSFSNESQYATESAPQWKRGPDDHWYLIDMYGRVVAKD